MLSKTALFLCGLLALTPMAVSAQSNEAVVSWEFATQYEDATPLPQADIAATRIEWGTCSLTNPFEFGTKLGEQDVVTPFNSVELLELPNGDTLCFRGYTVLDSGIISRPSGTAGKFYVPPPAIMFSADPTDVYEGNSTVLNWSSTGTSTCSASGAWAGEKALTGTEVSLPLQITSTFTLSCTGVQGTATSSVIVTVSPPPPPPPTLTFSATPASVLAGSSATLNWSSTDADSCTASGGWTGAKGTSGSQATPALNATTTFTLSCTGQSGSVSKSTTVTVTYPAPTVTVTANPSTVIAGDSTTINWSTEWTSTCTASGAWSGSKALGGFEVTPPINATSTFTLTCTGQGGTASDSVTVDVTYPAPTLTLSATPSTVMAGGSSTLTWTSTQTESCTASDGWTGSKPTAGSESVGPLNSPTTYTLACTGPGGSVTKSVTVGVTYPTPTLLFTANPTSVVAGGSSTLSWAATDAASCTASGAWTGTKSASGTQSTGALNQTSTFVLDCTGPGGNVTQSVTVDVTYLPPTVTISASPLTIVAGDVTTITWSSTNAVSCTASGAWSGARTTSGTEQSAPLTSSSTFTLTCTGQGGDTAAESVTILVTPPPMPPVLQVVGVGPQPVYEYAYARKARTYTLLGVVGSVPAGTPCNDVPIGTFGGVDYYQISKSYISWENKTGKGNSYAAICEWVTPTA